MKPEGSLPCTQQLYTEGYSVPDEISTETHVWAEIAPSV
jgi:hypothetical protein